MIKLENINLTFKDKVIFKDFCLHVEREEKVWLCAPSGRGKTSLFNMILGFLRPASGYIEVDSKPLQRSTISAIRRRICYIGQGAGLLGGKVADIISEIGDFAVNKHKDFTKEHVQELFSQFSLSRQTLEKNVETLSGGERQRLAFILCILMDRDIWLLDEITGGLDDERKKCIIDYIASCDKTVVVISHDNAWAGQQMRGVSW